MIYTGQTKNKLITHHTQLINALIEKYSLKSYLELGVNVPAYNFSQIKCESKVGVDPCLSTTYNVNSFLVGCTSDYFFETQKDRYFDKVDLVFIDGDHAAEQVEKDFENSLKCLSEKGFIVIHDVLPENEQGTLIPRQTRKWWGTVYKFAMNIGQYQDIDYKTFEIDEGCMLVWKDPGYVNKSYRPKYEETFERYIDSCMQAMNVVSEVII